MEEPVDPHVPDEGARDPRTPHLSIANCKVKARARVFDFKLTYQLRGDRKPWQFSRPQWHRLCRLMSLLKTPLDADRGDVMVPTLVELYLSYLHVTQGWRLETGIPESKNGGRIALQMASFVNALRSFLVLTESMDFLPDSAALRGRKTPMSAWGGVGDVPRFPLLTIPLLIPGWVSIGRILGDGLRDLSELHEGDLTRDMELWRRWEPGIAPTQCSGAECPFPETPLASLTACPRRLSSKTWHAQWQRQQRHFVSWVRTWPPIPELALTYPILWGKTVGQWALDHGLLCRADLRLHILYWSKIRSLTERLLRHNTLAAGAPMHVFDSAFHVCWRCARCQAIGHLNPRWGWMRMAYVDTTWDLNCASSHLKEEWNQVHDIMQS